MLFSALPVVNGYKKQHGITAVVAASELLSVLVFLTLAFLSSFPLGYSLRLIFYQTHNKSSTPCSWAQVI